MYLHAHHELLGTVYLQRLVECRRAGAVVNNIVKLLLSHQLTILIHHSRSMYAERVGIVVIIVEDGRHGVDILAVIECQFVCGELIGSDELLAGIAQRVSRECGVVHIVKRIGSLRVFPSQCHLVSGRLMARHSRHGCCCSVGRDRYVVEIDVILQLTQAILMYAQAELLAGQLLGKIDREIAPLLRQLCHRPGLGRCP